LRKLVRSDFKLNPRAMASLELVQLQEQLQLAEALELRGTRLTAWSPAGVVVDFSKHLAPWLKQRRRQADAMPYVHCAFATSMRSSTCSLGVATDSAQRAWRTHCGSRARRTFRLSVRDRHPSSLVLNLAGSQLLGQIWPSWHRQNRWLP